MSVCVCVSVFVREFVRVCECMCLSIFPFVVFRLCSFILVCSGLHVSPMYRFQHSHCAVGLPVFLCFLVSMF